MGDPVRAAEIMIRTAEMAEPPRHLVLGAWGYDAVTKRLRERLDEIEGLRETALAADFPSA